MNEMNNGENINQSQEMNNIQEQPVQQSPIQEQPVVEQKVEPPKKSYAGLLTIFIIISLALAGYIVYESYFKDNNEAKEPKESENINQSDEDSSKVAQELIDNYRVISERAGQYDQDFYLIKKSSNGTADYEVVKYLGRTSENFEYYFGFYNNRIYYSDLENIKYVDLTDESLTEKVWLKVPKTEPAINDDDEELMGPETAFELGAQIVGDSLYMKHYETNQFGYLNLNAKSFDEYKEITKKGNSIEDWTVVGDEDIYYTAFDHEVEGTSVLYHYNIKTKETRKIMVLGADHTFYYASGNIVYCKGTNSKKSEHEYVYNLFAYNVDTTETKKISDIIFDGYDNSCYSYFAATSDNVYYYDDHGTVMKYNLSSGDTSEYYKVVAKTNKPQGMYFVDDNNMTFYYYPSKAEYASNGENVESLPVKKVLMLDKTTKNFNIKTIKSIKETRY